MMGRSDGENGLLGWGGTEKKGSDVPAVVSRSAPKRPFRYCWNTTSTDWEQSFSQRVGVGWFRASSHSCLELSRVLSGWFG